MTKLNLDSLKEFLEKIYNESSSECANLTIKINQEINDIISSLKKQKNIDFVYLDELKTTACESFYESTEIIKIFKKVEILNVLKEKIQNVELLNEINNYLRRESKIGMVEKAYEFAQKYDILSNLYKIKSKLDMKGCITSNNLNYILENFSNLEIEFIENEIYNMENAHEIFESLDSLKLKFESNLNDFVNQLSDHFMIYIKNVTDPSNSEIIFDNQIFDALTITRPDLLDELLVKLLDNIISYVFTTVYEEVDYKFKLTICETRLNNCVNSITDICQRIICERTQIIIPMHDIIELNAKIIHSDIINGFLENFSEKLASIHANLTQIGLVKIEKDKNEFINDVEVLVIKNYLKNEKIDLSVTASLDFREFDLEVLKINHRAKSKLIDELNRFPSMSDAIYDAYVKNPNVLYILDLTDNINIDLNGLNTKNFESSKNFDICVSDYFYLTWSSILNILYICQVLNHRLCLQSSKIQELITLYQHHDLFFFDCLIGIALILIMKFEDINCILYTIAIKLQPNIFDSFKIKPAFLLEYIENSGKNATLDSLSNKRLLISDVYEKIPNICGLKLASFILKNILAKFIYSIIREMNLIILALIEHQNHLNNSTKYRESEQLSKSIIDKNILDYQIAQNLDKNENYFQKKMSEKIGNLGLKAHQWTKKLFETTFFNSSLQTSDNKTETESQFVELYHTIIDQTLKFDSTLLNQMLIQIFKLIDQQLQCLQNIYSSNSLLRVFHYILQAINKKNIQPVKPFNCYFSNQLINSLIIHNFFNND